MISPGTFAVLFFSLFLLRPDFAGFDQIDEAQGSGSTDRMRLTFRVHTQPTLSLLGLFAYDRAFSERVHTLAFTRRRLSARCTLYTCEMPSTATRTGTCIGIVPSRLVHLLARDGQTGDDAVARVLRMGTDVRVFCDADQQETCESLALAHVLLSMGERLRTRPLPNESANAGPPPASDQPDLVFQSSEGDAFPYYRISGCTNRWRLVLPSEPQPELDSTTTSGVVHSVAAELELGAAHVALDETLAIGS